MWLSYGRNAIIVDGVISKSPAAQAGIQPGDQLTSIDGISARSIDLPGLRSRLASAAPGTLRLTVRRNDREEVVVVFPRALI
jgi:C-terminal processing protease CtpA/Prc